MLGRRALPPGRRAPRSGPRSAWTGHSAFQPFGTSRRRMSYPLCAAHIVAAHTTMALRPVEFHILLALAGEELHGYAILQEVVELTGGDLELEPGTLYRALRRMLADGWVAESGRRPAADVDDERR